MPRLVHSAQMEPSGTVLLLCPVM